MVGTKVTVGRTWTNKHFLLLLPNHAITKHLCDYSFLQGKYYMVIEQVSQLYRNLTPIPMWIAYLSDYTESHWIVSYSLTLVYLLAKVSFRN